MSDLPGGTATFLMTDVEGSTALWERDPETMGQSIARHDAVVEARVTAHDGVLLKARGEGDSHFAVFGRAADAVTCAGDLQAALAGQLGPGGEPLLVRIAVHSGDAEVREGDYYGPAVNRCARLRSIAHGGQVLISSTASALLQDGLPPGFSVLDLGTHRLKDLSLPERVGQLRGPGLLGEFPPVRSLDAHPHNLPVQLTSFIGRDSALLEVGELLRGTRLLTLIGAGGAGKTRLALQIAADSVDAYADGVWLVELAPVTDERSVVATVGDALGLRESAGRSQLDVLTNHLRERTMLLVLDNCEHVVEVAAELCEAVLAQCPGVSVLATSREGLGVRGEIAWRVPSLEIPDSSEVPAVEVLDQFGAVQLFLQRASAARPEFRLTSANAAGVAHVVRRLEGIPLALELAAARLGALTVEQVASRLDDRFKLLTGGSRTALPRHQTLRAMVDWSYDLLTAPEATVLRRLSVFLGGASLEAVEEVCAGDGIDHGDVLDLLARLVDKSMAIAEPVEHETRYRLLETIRQYARDKLREGEDAGAAVRDRHFGCFLGVAERLAAGAWFGDGEGDVAPPRLRELEADHDNLRAALERGREAPHLLDGWLRLVALLGPFWLGLHHWSEGRRWVDDALTERDRLAPDGRLRLLSAHQELCFRQVRNADFRPFFDEIVAVAEEVADRRLLAGVLNRAGGMAWQLADYKGAVARFLRALSLYRELEDRAMEGLLLQSLGRVEDSQGKRDDAARFYEEALTIQRSSASTHDDPWVLTTMGRHALDAGDLVRARECFEEYAEHARRSADRGRRSRAAQSLGELALKEGDASSARSHFDERLMLARQIDDRSLEGWALANLATALYALDDPVLARQRVDESLALFRDLGADSVAVTVLYRVAESVRQGGDLVLARRLLDEALGLARGDGNDGPIAQVLDQLGVVARAQGRNEEALSHHRMALDGFRKVGDDWGVLVSLRRAGIASAAAGGHEEAARFFGGADVVAERVGESPTRAEAIEVRGWLDNLRDALGGAAFDAAVHAGALVEESTSSTGATRPA